MGCEMSQSSAAIQDEEFFLDSPYREAMDQGAHSETSSKLQIQDQLDSEKVVEERLSFPRNAYNRQSHFYSKSSWEGVVTSVENGLIRALIHSRDSANQDQPDEIELDLQQVPEGDLSLVSENALFYLSIGKSRVAGGIPQSTVSLVFRRQPVWSERDLERREAISEEIFDILHGTE